MTKEQLAEIDRKFMERMTAAGLERANVRLPEYPGYAAAFCWPNTSGKLPSVTLHIPHADLKLAIDINAVDEFIEFRVNKALENYRMLVPEAPPHQQGETVRSTVLENLRRRQERGEISPKDAESTAKFFKVALDWHEGDEEAAKKSIAAWIAKVRARNQVPKPPPVPTSVKILQAMVGCAVGAGVGLATTHVLIYLFWSLFAMTGATRVRVPIAGALLVFAAPIIGAVLGALVGWSFNARLTFGRPQWSLATASQLDRAWIAWGAVWTAIVLVVFAVFEPFGRYYWRSDDVIRFLVIWVGPIIGGWVVAQLVRWVASGRRLTKAVNPSKPKIEPT